MCFFLPRLTTCDPGCGQEQQMKLRKVHAQSVLVRVSLIPADLSKCNEELCDETYLGI